MNEGYEALLIAIICEVTTEDAFLMLRGKRSRRNHKWTPEEMEDIKALRERGVQWAEIGSMYGVRWQTVAKRFSHYKNVGRI